MSHIDNQFNNLLDNYFNTHFQNSNTETTKNFEITSITEENLPDLLKNEGSIGTSKSNSRPGTAGQAAERRFQPNNFLSNSSILGSIPSDISKLSSNTENTDFFDILLNGEGDTKTGNSTGNIDYSKMNRKLDKLLESSVNTNNSDSNPTGPHAASGAAKNISNYLKKAESPKKLGMSGTFDDINKIASLQLDDSKMAEAVTPLKQKPASQEEEETSWPMTPTNEQKSENYENDFDFEGDEDVKSYVTNSDINLEPIQEAEDQTASEQLQIEPNLNPVISKSEPELSKEVKINLITPENVDSKNEPNIFDLSPIHSSQIDPSASKSLKNSIVKFSVDQKFTETTESDFDSTLQNSPKNATKRLSFGGLTSSGPNPKSRGHSTDGQSNPGPIPVRYNNAASIKTKNALMKNAETKKIQPVNHSKKYANIPSSGYGQVPVQTYTKQVEQAGLNDSKTNHEPALPNNLLNRSSMSDFTAQKQDQEIKVLKAKLGVGGIFLFLPNIWGTFDWTWPKIETNLFQYHRKIFHSLENFLFSANNFDKNDSLNFSSPRNRNYSEF